MGIRVFCCKILLDSCSCKQWLCGTQVLQLFLRSLTADIVYIQID